MKVVLTNFGTRGDFEPLIALGQELVRRGHQATFAVPGFVEPMLVGLPFQFHPIGLHVPDVRDTVNLFWSTDPAAYTDGDRLLRELSPLRDQMLTVLHDLRQACGSADVLISGAAQPLARLVHDLTTVPFVAVQVSNFGGSGGPAIVDAGDQIINTIRNAVGLSSVRQAFTHGSNSPQLTLYAMSKHLRPRPDSWPKHYHLTGFLFRNPVEPDESLVEFIKSGSPPIVVSLGSMPHKHKDVILGKLRSAANSVGRRLVIQGFPESDLASESSSEIYWAGYVSHAWLFPRAACVVTHGGAGTAAAIFRSGTAGVFVPHGEIYDQHYWAQLAHEYGCAPAPIAISDLTVANLSTAISACLTDSSVRVTATQLGTKIRSEHGTQYASQLIERLVEQVGLAPTLDAEP